MKFLKKIKNFLGGIYDLTPQSWAMQESEKAQIRAEQRERDYNSPKAQMSRYAEAGLNPALMYGGGSPGAAGNVGSSAPKQEAPAGILQMLIGGIQMGAQIASVASQNSLRAVQQDVGQTTVGKLEADTARSWAQTKEINQKVEYLDSVNPDLAQTIRQRMALNEKELGMYSFTVQEKEAAIQNMRAQLKILGKQEDLMDADGKLKAAVLERKGIENKLLEMERAFVQDGEFNTKQFWQMFLSLLRIGPSFLKR